MAQLIARDLVNLRQAIKRYVTAFEEKHELQFEFWVGDMIGTVAMFSDYFFKFEDIIIDLETYQPGGQIFEWYNACIEHQNIKDPTKTHYINYSSWCKGARFEMLNDKEETINPEICSNT